MPLLGRRVPLPREHRLQEPRLRRQHFRRRPPGQSGLVQLKSDAVGARWECHACQRGKTGDPVSACRTALRLLERDRRHAHGHGIGRRRAVELNYAHDEPRKRECQKDPFVLPEAARKLPEHRSLWLTLRLHTQLFLVTTEIEAAEIASWLMICVAVTRNCDRLNGERSRGTTIVAPGGTEC